MGGMLLCNTWPVPSLHGHPTLGSGGLQVRTPLHIAGFLPLRRGYDFCRVTPLKVIWGCQDPPHMAESGSLKALVTLDPSARLTAAIHKTTCIPLSVSHPAESPCGLKVTWAVVSPRYTSRYRMTLILFLPNNLSAGGSWLRIKPRGDAETQLRGCYGGSASNISHFYLIGLASIQRPALLCTVAFQGTM